MGKALRLLMLSSVVLAGCATGGNTNTDGGRDTGTRRRDAGRTGDCGDVGERCCTGATQCRGGAQCSGTTCCSPPRASCSTARDCCGADVDCTSSGTSGKKCCRTTGGQCRSPDQCCGDLVCGSDGRCQVEEGERGREGKPCLEGDVCRSAGSTLLTCVRGTCVQCGSDGKICCKPPQDRCADGFVCGSAKKCERPATDCGDEGEACCDGDECTLDSLHCTGGRCRPKPASCELADDCRECLATDGCGYCPEEEMCAPGSASGPTGIACLRWISPGGRCTTTSTPDPCSSNNCDACTDEAGCGWCTDGGGKCMPGTDSRPTSGSCSGTWDFYGFACDGAENCDRHDDCTTCTAVGEWCGWCASDETCYSLDDLLVTECNGATEIGAVSPEECAAGVEPCARYSSAAHGGSGDCATCLLSAEGICGWCNDSGRCLNTHGDGEILGECDDSEWVDVGSACGSCAALQSACTSASMCCDSVGCRRVLSLGRDACCKEAGVTCTTGADCCGFMDCIGSRCTARDAGSACLDNRDCVSNNCGTDRRCT